MGRGIVNILGTVFRSVRRPKRPSSERLAESGLCPPDIMYEDPEGRLGIVEILSGYTGPSIRQTEMFPQIENGDAIPLGHVAVGFRLAPGVPMRKQGYPDGIPIEEKEVPFEDE